MIDKGIVPNETLLSSKVLLNSAIFLADVSKFEETFLHIRGFQGGENDGMQGLNNFFSPSVESLHDPFLFPQMNAAVERILQARTNGERVVIFGDYDVDGVSSTAMLVRFFAMIGIAVSYRIPHRSRDGYGMKTYFFDDLAEKKVALVVSVDCGTRDIEVIRYAKKLGIDVIVTDHHAVPEFIPDEAIAIITPKLPNTSYPFSGLSGSGTAFKLLSAVARKLYTDDSEYERIVASFSDFAALGTVADMVPLIGENRTIVQLGLNQISSSRSPGLRAMVSGLDTGSADCIGFQIGPRINAAGRIEHADIALQALLCSELRANEYIQKLEDLNLTRRKVTAEHFEIAESIIDPTAPILIHSSDTIEHGVIGLVAGRLCEKYKRPSIVCKIEDGKYFGSARSPDGYNITDALSRHSHYFIAFGGHAQAAGFTLSEMNFSAFVQSITDDAQSFFSQPPKDDAQQNLDQKEGGDESYLLNLSTGLKASSGVEYPIDYILPVESIDFDLVDTIEKFGPYGMGYKKPLFLVFSRVIPRVEFLGSSGEHIRFLYSHLPSVKLQAFGLGSSLSKIQSIHTGIGYICEIQREVWKGRVSISLMVKDVLEISGL